MANPPPSHDRPHEMLLESPRTGAERSNVVERSGLAIKEGEARGPIDDLLNRVIETQAAEREFLTELAVEVAAVKRSLDQPADLTSDALAPSPINTADVQELRSALLQVQALVNRLTAITETRQNSPEGLLEPLQQQLLELQNALVGREQLILGKLDKASDFDSHLQALRGALRDALSGFQEAFRRRDEQYGKRLEELLQVLQRDNRNALLSLAHELPERLQSLVSEPMKATYQIESATIRAELLKLMQLARQNSNTGGMQETVAQLQDLNLGLVDEARSTGRSVELIAQALHELQGEISGVRRVVTERLQGRSDEGESLLLIQSELQNISRHLKAQEKQIEHLEVELKSQLLDSKGSSSGWGMFVVTLAVFTLVAGAGAFYFFKFGL